LLVGSLSLPYFALCVVIGGAGIGTAGCQHGVNAVSGALYPTVIRSTGAGWALGVGRIGQIVGPLSGGLLLGFGWPPRDIFLAASGPALAAALGMAALTHLRSREDRPAATTPSGLAPALRPDGDAL
jgi:AAHS family 4-hydroxybenzoate transporter-like MFS transporter